MTYARLGYSVLVLVPDKPMPGKCRVQTKKFSSQHHKTRNQNQPFLEDCKQKCRYPPNSEVDLQVFWELIQDFELRNICLCLTLVSSNLKLMLYDKQLTCTNQAGICS